MNDSQDLQSWRIIQRTAFRKAISESSLVLAALDLEHKIEEVDELWCLSVPAEIERTAMRELENYAAENSVRPVIRTRLITFDSGWFGVFVYLSVIWLIPALEANSVFDWDWREFGRLQAQLVREGQWWRPFTAMTLHADLPHILGNSLFGGVIGLSLGRYLGSGYGWLLVVLAAATGNALNAFVQPDSFSAIGASTANFAAIGLVGSFVWRRGYLRAVTWQRNVAPLFAAFCLLAFTGLSVGDGNVDVMGHVFGFVSGIIFGLVVAGFDIRRLGVSGQILCGVFTLVLLGVAWSIAGGVAGTS